MNDIQQVSTKFKLQDSNYLITMSHNDEHVIEQWQIKKIIDMLNDSRVEFVSINNTIQNKRFIRSIEPTTRKLTSDGRKIPENSTGLNFYTSSNEAK